MDAASQRAQFAVDVGGSTVDLSEILGGMGMLPGSGQSKRPKIERKRVKIRDVFITVARLFVNVVTLRVSASCFAELGPVRRRGSGKEVNHS